MSIAPAIVDNLGGHRVLVIGDLMIDEYLRGDVHRVSPEAPVPVLDLKATEHRLGGAANTAANLQHLGAIVTVIGVVGDDDGARILTAALARAGITSHTCADGDRPTTRKTRLVAGGHQIARIDAERRTPIAGAIALAVVAAIQAETATADAVVISDYAKGVITPAIAAAAIAAARARGVPVIVDPKQRDFGVYAGATVITPNLVELERASGSAVGTLAEIDGAVGRLAAALGGAALLVTRGADGMTLYRDGARGPHVPATAREVFDVTGAGDTVVATLTLALSAGISLEDAMVLASLAAGISVSRRGTSTVGPDELRDAIRAGR
ncbi:MAG: D-glycero-beta-D-manno-heptose-7-phosphate kinase [Deltaproteobacteria bacterium]|nr:D-glycero-beta-D-manno-heptose-7-phosphate kinase [Deltaproteobacteria bacterium]